MQPTRYLKQWLEESTNNKCFLFTFQDLRALFPKLSDTAYKTMLSRAVHAGHLIRACRGLYLYKKAAPTDGLLLFHIVAKIRADEFNYISLETVLSDASIISQIPINTVSIMSSGRSNIISCGEFGTIEFVHTKQKASDLLGQLSYDSKCGLWRANAPLALRDMKVTHRNCDLIDWSIANEFI